MPAFYNQVYKVPAWVVINTANTDYAKRVVKKFAQNGVYEVQWIAKSFPTTINDLGDRGWSHEVHKPMPFAATPDFISFAATKHLALYGHNKTLSGTPDVPLHRRNRTINSGDDYVRIFNDILANEPANVLSHIFNIGDLCHSDQSHIKTFVSVGPVELKVLQKISERVISINVAEDGTLVVDGGVEGEVLTNAVLDLIQQVGYKP